MDGRSARGDRTAAALVEAAREQFARRGYAGASVRDVARAARVHPALVRYHFRSKAALYERVLGDALDALAVRLVEAFGAGGTLAERAGAALSAYLDHLERDRDLPRLIQRALLDGDRRTLRIVRERFGALAAVLRAAPAGAADLGVTLFGAAVAPFLYAPAIEALSGESPLDPAALARRRAHLLTLVTQSLKELP